MSTTPMMHRYRFTVRGADAFPTDMLRRDHCYPDDTGDAMAMADSWGEPSPDSTVREITLVHTTLSPMWKPTRARWVSFGWSVGEVKVTVTPV